jgi:hypothetical protein
MRRGWWGLLLVGFASAHATTRPAVGWVLDTTAYHAGPVAADGFSRDFYPTGQGEHDWQERFSVGRWPGNAPDAEALMAALEEARRATCPDFSSQPLPLGDDAVVRMWTCPREGAGDEGRTEFVRTLVHEGTGYFARATLRGPAFGEDGVVADLTEQRLSRYAEFVATFLPCTSLVVFGCVPPEAVLGKYGELVPTPEERASLQHIAGLGLQLYRQDQLAWHATDYARAKGLLDGHEGGFLSVAGAGLEGTTYFVAASGDRITGAIRVDTGADGHPTAHAVLPALPEALLPRWRARQTALAAGTTRCSDTVNTIVLPRDGGDGFLVYVMSGVTDERRVFLGGHTRFVIDASGGQVLVSEDSARSCLAVDAVALRGNGHQVGGFFTHLVSDLPWETDVMQSLTYAFPLTRVTEHAIWRIEGDGIRKFAVGPGEGAGDQSSSLRNGSP